MLAFSYISRTTMDGRVVQRVTTSRYTRKSLEIVTCRDTTRCEVRCTRTFFSSKTDK